jgi:hypothetical protein
MTLLGKDYEKMEVACGNFVIQGENLFFAVGDGEQNLHVFQYDPESWFPCRLVTDVRSAIVVWQSPHPTS